MMFIPNTMPSTLAEMLAFLLPTVEDGLFDSVAYDDDENPTKIVCMQGGNTILEISGSGRNWTLTPYVASGEAATAWTMRSDAPSFPIIRCSGGVYVSHVFNDGSGSMFVIAKTSSGKTGFISSSFGTGGFRKQLQYKTICFGDNTTLSLYTNGYYVSSNLNNADRTILSTLPVVGAYGSTDYFTSAYVCNVMQFSELGVQIIDGKKYGCVGYIAFLDE